MVGHLAFWLSGSCSWGLSLKGTGCPAATNTSVISCCLLHKWLCLIRFLQHVHSNCVTICSIYDVRPLTAAVWTGEQYNCTGSHLHWRSFFLCVFFISGLRRIQTKTYSVLTLTLILCTYRVSLHRLFTRVKFLLPGSDTTGLKRMKQVVCETKPLIVFFAASLGAWWTGLTSLLQQIVCIGFSLSIGVSKSLMNASTRVESGCTALWFVITGCSNNLAGKSRNFYLHVPVYVYVCLCPSLISTVHLWCSMLLSAVFSQSPKRQVFMPWVFPCLYMHDHIGQ